MFDPDPPSQPVPRAVQASAKVHLTWCWEPVACQTSTLVPVKRNERTSANISILTGVEPLAIVSFQPPEHLDREYTSHSMGSIFLTSQTPAHPITILTSLPQIRVADRTPTYQAHDTGTILSPAIPVPAPPQSHLHGHRMDSPSFHTPSCSHHGMALSVQLRFHLTSNMTWRRIKHLGVTSNA